MTSPEMENSSVESSEDELIPYKCHECGIYFCNKYLLMRHIKTNHGEKSDEKYKCEMCEGKEFRYLEDLKIHTERDHTLDLIIEFQCHICEKKYDYQYRLHRHNLSHHSDFEPDELVHNYECFYCDKKSNSNIVLYRHILIDHSNKCKLKAKCPFCEEFFHRKYKWLEHVVTCHPEVYPFECHVCGELFEKLDCFLDCLIHHAEIDENRKEELGEEDVAQKEDTKIEEKPEETVFRRSLSELQSQPKDSLIKMQKHGRVDDDGFIRVATKAEQKLYPENVQESYGDEAAGVEIQTPFPRVKFLKNKFESNEGLKPREKLSKFQCLSGELFTADRLKRHLIGNRYTCKYCEKIFKDADEIQKHKAEEHPNEN